MLKEMKIIIVDLCKRLGISDNKINILYENKQFSAINTGETDILTDFALESIETKLFQTFLLQKKRRSLDFSKERIVLDLQNYVDSQIDNWLYLSFGIDFDMINQLSGMTYETSKANGILLIDSTKQNKSDISFVKSDISFDVKYKKAIRKYLEGCTKDYGLHIRLCSNDNDGKKYEVIGYRSKIEWDQLSIRILGGFKWEFSIANGKVYRVNGTHVSVYKDQTDEIISCLLQEFSISDDNESKEIYRKLINKLKEQGHGTSVVFLEFTKGQEERINKLINTNRAVCIDCKIDKFLKTKENEELLYGISKIDGAFIVDAKENLVKCFSAILDGNAIRNGDIGRGARYNSVANFLQTLRAKDKALAIVFSEDGDVNLLKRE